MKLLIVDRELTLTDIEASICGKLKGKEVELFRSIQGFFMGHHWFILKTLLGTIANLEGRIEVLELQIRSLMKDQNDLLDCMKKAWAYQMFQLVTFWRKSILLWIVFPRIRHWYRGAVYVLVTMKVPGNGKAAEALCASIISRPS